MEDERKTRAQLIAELSALRQQVARTGLDPGAETALPESEARLRIIADSVPVLISYVDHEMTYRFVNKEYERWFGMPREAFVGKRVCDLLDEAAFARSLPHIRKALSGEEVRFEARTTLPSGFVKHSENHFVPDIATDGHVRGYFVVVSDITGHKQSENALRRSEERFRRIFESSLVGIVFAGPKGEILRANDAFVDMVGYSELELQQKTFSDISDPGELDQNLHFFGEMLAGERDGYHMEKRYLNKDGRTVWGDLDVSAVRGDDGQFQFLIGIIRDITERKRMEEDIRRSHNLESLGVLAGGIAHDFNNILTGVMGSLDLLSLMLEEESDAHNLVRQAREAADRTVHLTSQLMTFAKGGAPVKETASLPQLITETVKLTLRGSRTKPDYHFPRDLAAVDIDRGLIGQVIQNLTINADQAMPTGGLLNISAENVNLDPEDGQPLPAGPYVKVSVSDEGKGMSQEVTQKIFDPYFSTKQTGHGLGLAITHSIISRHNGHITVESQIEVGSTFAFFLPASDRPVSGVSEAREELAGGNERILLMDDEEVIQRTVGKMLSQLGYRVDQARDGAEALRSYEAATRSGDPFDLVIMDLTIPGGMGGKDAMQRLLELDENARAIVSTGYSSDPVMARYSDHGFRGRVTKPVALPELARVVRGVLDNLH